MPSLRAPANALLLTLLTTSVLQSGCGGGKGEDRPNVDVIGGGGEGSASVSGPAEGYGDPLYFPGTNQDANLAIGTDLQEMRSIMSAAARGDAVDWAAATAIYRQGKHQRLADGSTRTLAALASGDYPAAFPGAQAVFGRQDFVGGIIEAGLDGTGSGAGLSGNSRRQLVDKGIQVLMYGRALQNLAMAEARFAEGSPDAGAAIDEAWATLSGARDPSTQSPNSGLLATALAREEDFRLPGRLARPLESSLFAARGAAERKDQPALARELNASRGYLNTIMYLSTLRYARVLELDQRDSDREFHLAEAWAFFQGIRPLVERASPASARVVNAAYSRSAADEFPSALTAQVYAALNEAPVLAALGIPAEFQFKAPPQ